MTRIMVLLLASLSACGNAASAETTPLVVLGSNACAATLRLEIDNLFDKQERVEIMKAIVDWRIASGNRVCFRIAWRDTSGDERTFRSDGRFSIYNWKRPWQVRAATTVDRTPCPKRESCLGVTIWEHGGRASDVFVLTANLAFLRALVEHELGHVFGLKHTAVYDSIMFSDIRKDKMIGRIDRKNLDCLLKTQTFLQNENDCVYTR
jgi:hypothetical protein